MIEIVAEVGPCEGSIGYAKQAAQELIAAKEETGYDAITMKGQWYLADELARPDAARYDETDGRDLTQHELFQAQLSEAEWGEVVAYCQAYDLDFFPTVFSERAVDLAYDLGLDRVKIASGDITHEPLIRYAAERVQRLVISTGASTMDEVAKAVIAARDAHAGVDLTVLACHLAYPSDGREANLLRMTSLHQLGAKLGRMHVGYSDHTAMTTEGGMLLALGASMWEKHYTALPGESRTEGDHTFAVDKFWLKDMTKRVTNAVALLGDPALAPTASEAKARHGARRGTYATEAIRKGDRVTMDKVEFLRPADGMSPAEFRLQLKKKAVAMVDVAAGDPITSTMFGAVGGTLTVE